MRGELLWFNEEKEYGLIQAEGGERVPVHASGFARGHVPVGRCAGTPVSFELEPDGEGTRAVSVTVLHVAAPRRARMRSQRNR